jgi:hypothetical protein
MMTYILNDYYKNANSTDTRVEVYSDNKTAANLLAYHKQNRTVELMVHECVDANKPTLPMPGTLMQTLDMKITASKKRVIVTGIDAYLSLLSEKNVKNFMSALYSRIDEGKLNAVYLVSRNRFDASNFSNPKFENSLQVVYIGDNGQHIAQPSVNVVSQKWLQQGGNSDNWSTLLKMIGQFERADEYTLVLDDYVNKQAGLSDSVSQYLNISSIAEHFYKISANLPKNVLEKLVIKCKESNADPLDFIKSQFGSENINIRSTVKRLLELQNDELWLAYIWLLKNTIDGNSYLARVLSANITSDNLLRSYVCDITITVLADANTRRFTDERASAIKEIGNGADSLIIEFISKIKQQPNETAAYWLNCGTKAEQIEIVRRVSESDLTIGLPQIWLNLYPLLTDYLSDEYDYGSNDLTAYFRDYRRLKIRNSVTENFAKRASDFVLPPAFAFRDAVLQNLSADTNTALLVVDGMGAEYFPLIHAIAKRKSMNVESAAIAAVKLPTSTEFNLINWEESRRLKSNIHEIDDILHNGAKKHENSSPPHNIVATLAVFEDIINRVADGLTQFERVVVTSDHGSSRLAVLAHEKGFIKTLPWNGEPQDWRYSIASPNMERPSEFEPFYDVEKNITYWVVRGYNRLPKKGPKLNELHGGATLEEKLVPIVVFSRTKSDSVMKQASKQKIEQLVEKPDLDI